MIKSVLFITLAAVLSHSAHAELYQWRDENGKLHFSDRASDKQAQAITVKSLNGYNGEEAKAVHDSARKSTQQPEKRSTHMVPPYQLSPPSNAPSQQEIQERVADCERRRIVGCDEARARREIADEAYRNTPGGQRQQERIRDRKMREWVQQR